MEQEDKPKKKDQPMISKIIDEHKSNRHSKLDPIKDGF